MKFRNKKGDSKKFFPNYLFNTLFTTFSLVPA